MRQEINVEPGQFGKMNKCRAYLANLAKQSYGVQKLTVQTVQICGICCKNKKNIKLYGLKKIQN